MLNSSVPAPWRASHPLWQCGLRPFFLGGAVVAIAVMGWWLAFLFLGIGAPPAAAAQPGGLALWHGQVLLLGFGLAAVAGFALTALPEFTATPSPAPAAIRALAGCWGLSLLGAWIGPQAGWLGGWLGWWLSLAGQLGLIGGLLVLLAPRLWRDPGRRHLAFAWALLALGLIGIGWHADLWRGVPPARWLRAALDVLMVLIVVAMSRISMRIVNTAIDQRREEARLQAAADAAGEGAGDGREAELAGLRYLARPPRRQMATACILAHAVSEWFAPGHAVGGWLALAAAAAVLNLLGDWHVGRALWRRWPLMLYQVYLLMALGYGVMGLGTLLGEPMAGSSGLHLLAVGAFGLGIYLVCCIAGRAHVGLALDERPWVPAGAGLLVAAALTRAWAPWSDASAALMAFAGLAWIGAYGLLMVRLAPWWWRRRSDGQTGCAGPLAADAGCELPVRPPAPLPMLRQSPTRAAPANR